MIRDYIDHYYFEGDYNCAETMLRACGEAWNIAISEDLNKAMGGFGGGLYSGLVCGAITGGVAAMAQLYVDRRGHTSPVMKEKTQRFTGLVKERMGDCNCTPLKEKFWSEGERCHKTVVLIADILDEVVGEDYL